MRGELFKEKLRSTSATLLYTFKSPDALAEVGWKVLVIGELGGHKNNRSRAKNLFFVCYAFQQTYMEVELKHSKN